MLVVMSIVTMKKNYFLGEDFTAGKISLVEGRFVDVAKLLNV